YLQPEQITSFVVIVGAESAEITPTVEVGTEVPGDIERRGPNWLLLGGLCLGMLVVAAGAIYFFLIRGRSSDIGSPETLESRGYSQGIGEFEGEEGFTVGAREDIEIPLQEEPALPVAQFMTTYMVGDDLYDDSFSIDAPTGEFLGECGVGISETVGVGEPKRVTALEVWLFDKNDIQTVTKVVMSEHAFEDEKLRMRLESKGEPILAETGKQILLETATLQLEARIVDMEYGEGAAPDQSFFQRLTFELAVWPK
ncbi:MAG: hypothetical protein SVT56_10775, partial [Chloroflexota bacterium]|nr:hypothetical protein [Chloroflexota bacterium]